VDVRHRLSVIVIVCVCLFSTLFARLAYLQVVQGRELEIVAEKNLTQMVIVPAKRGRIFDRQGHILVDNRTVPTVLIVKAHIPSRAAARAALFDRLGAVIGKTGAEIARRFNAIDNLQGVEVARPVSETALVYLAEHQDEFPGVEVRLESQRVYPRGTLASHVLGYVSDIGDSLKSQPCGGLYQTGDKIGKTGIESKYECILRGMPGVNELVVDRKNNVKEVHVLAPPIAGVDIRLTIDPDIQALTEKALDAGLRAARSQYGKVYLGNPKKDAKVIPTFLKANAGAAVVMDTTNGSVYSMVSRPDYDPSEFVRGISSKDFLAKYGDEKGGPLTNRAVEGRYAPGSTFKLITAVSAMVNGLITANTTIEDTGKFELPDCKKNTRCTFSNSGGVAHGKVDLRRSLSVSSDVFYYRLGYRFWIESRAQQEAIQETAGVFGFGDDTNIALPNEKSSPVPDAATKKARHLSDPDIWPDGDWRTGDNLNLAIGQGEMLTTPIQLACAYAAFANGGDLYNPRIAFDTPDALKAPVIDPTARDTTSTSTTTSTTVVGPAPTTVPTTVVELPTLIPPTSSSDSTLTTDPGGSPAASTTVVIGRNEANALTADGRFGPYLESNTLQGQSNDTSIPTTVSNEPTTTPPVSGSTLGGGSASQPPTLTPKLRRRIVDLTPDVRDPILAGLRGVVTDKEGTASPAFAGFPFSQFPIAGKTGTAQVLGKQDYSLFVAFGGPNNRFVVVVVMEQSGFGGQAAAPVARQIFNGLAGLTVGDVNFIQQAAQDK
jgi:penicillin-binding protein 2